MRNTAELFSREYALTLSTEGSRLHASIFRGQELEEGHAEIPVSLELVAVLEEYEKSTSTDPDVISRLEARVKQLTDAIVKEMKGDRVAKSLTNLFIDEQSSSTLQYYVNWRAVVLKLHETLLRVEGLDEILELHRPGSRVRKQVALPSHPTRELLRSKEMAPPVNQQQQQKSRVPLFHKPAFHPIRARSRPATFRAAEQERKEELLRSLTPSSKTSTVSTTATPLTTADDSTPATPSNSSVNLASSTASPTSQVNETPTRLAGRSMSSLPAVMSEHHDSPSRKNTADQEGIRPKPNISAPHVVHDVPIEPSKRRPQHSAELMEEEELSVSLPGRFAGAGPIPPARLTDAIRERHAFSVKAPHSPEIAPAAVAAVPSSAGSSADSTAPQAPRAEVAPPFRMASKTLEQFVYVHPTDRFVRPDDVAPPDRQLSLTYDAVTGEWEKAPDWMRFVVHWNGTSPVAGPSADPRGVRIPLPFLLMAIQAHGAYDHALSSVVCLALWKAAGSPKLTLGPYLPPGFLDRNGIHMQNRALALLEKDFQLLCKGPVTDAKIRALQKHLVMASGSSTATKQVLQKLTSSVSFAVRSNIVASTERYERLCIQLLGSEDDTARETAVKLLNIIYDGHDWQKNDAFDPVIRSVGDCFVVEMDASSLGGDVSPQSVLLQVCMLPFAGSGQRVTFCVRPKLVSSNGGGVEDRTSTRKLVDRLVVDWLPLFNRCGFVDWRFVRQDDAGILTPFSSSQPASGRVIVMPKLRHDVMHELSVANGITFSSIASRVRDLQRAGVTTLYVSGCCAGVSVDEIFDRRVPNSAAGGTQGFAELIAEAKKVGIHVIVDSDHRISASGHARRYSPLVAHQLDASRRYIVPLEGHDGLNMPFPRCVMLNYRKKETWDELVGDLMEWCGRGAAGVRLAASHCTPLLLRTDSKEMSRLDPDGQPHYSVEQIMEGSVCLPPTNEAVTWGYFGTEASSTYPNPLLVKMAMAAWRAFPECRLFSESYWGRASNSLMSGFVPQSAELAAAINSTFGISITPDLKLITLPQRSSVKVLYDWFRDERSRYPSNSVLVNASSHHFLPYPLLLHGPGAWSVIDLLYFGPDIPSTFYNEMYGDTKWWSPSSLYFPEAAGREIAGHYAHRARLRSANRVLRDGGFLPLLTFWGDSADQKSWHERVFAFARFTSDKVAICAINFNDVESVVYIDLSPLMDICDQADGTVFKILDLIDPSSPAKYFVPSEFLIDKHFVTLPPYRSVLLGIFVEAMSPSTERTLMEQSFRRLQEKQSKRQDASLNLVYRGLVDSLSSIEKFGNNLTNLIRVLKPDPRSPFPEDMRRIFYFLSRNDKMREASIINFLKHLASHSNEATLKDLTSRILEANEIGPIVFITPEMGRFSTVGGIGVMVSELTRSLAELGLDVRVISPYYNYDKKGNTGYLEAEGIKWQQNIVTSVGNEFVECGLHYGEEMGVKLYFLHHWRYFSTPYQSGSPADQLQALVVMAKASLEMLCQLHVIPSIVITNDWFTGLVPAYARHTGSFGSSFVGTTFFHLVHNLEQGYEGKIYVDGNDDLGHIHQMRREHIVESYDGRVTVLNASKCALLSCNQWGTVSRSYRDDLLRVSPLQHLLKQFEAPFAHLNGIRSAERYAVLKKAGATDHAEAKRIVQEKYFGRSDPNIALYAFVGRVVLQKGVHLILECARALLSRPNCQIQIMVCGPANKKDPYASSCAWKMAALCTEFRGSFWADPDLFFTDGTLVNAGADFALMPSLFEPSGIVQQEFFSGGTPVIAFKTGGLKDTVFEFNPQTGQGNGLTFEAHQFDDLMSAIDRSLKIFKNASLYEKLRSNAKQSVLDNSVVADAWARQFCTLKQRLWAPPVRMQDQENASSVTAIEHGSK